MVSSSLVNNITPLLSSNDKIGYMEVSLNGLECINKYVTIQSVSPSYNIEEVRELYLKYVKSSYPKSKDNEEVINLLIKGGLL